MSSPKSNNPQIIINKMSNHLAFGTLFKNKAMFKSMLNIIRNKGIIHAKKDYNSSESNMEIDFNKPFAVIRENNKIIHQFDDFYDASVFSIKLNTSYKDNGIKAFSKVIKLSV